MSKIAMYERLNNAADVLLNPNATDEEIDQALNTIYDARDALDKKAEKDR